MTENMQPREGLDLDHMAEHPSDYGFEWAYGTVHKRMNGDKVAVCGRAPYIEYRNLDLCIETFGRQHFLDMANGTSGRVRDQDAVREPCTKDLKLRTNLPALKIMVLERALNQKSRRGTITVVEKEVPKFFDIGGNEHASQAEAMAASIDIMQAKQEQAQQQ